MSNAPGEKPDQTGGKQPKKGDAGQSGKGGQQPSENPTGAKQPKQGGSQQDPKGALPRYDDRPEQGSRSDDDEVEGGSAPGEPRYGDREKDDPRRSHVEGQRPKPGSGGGEQRPTSGSTNR